MNQEEIIRQVTELCARERMSLTDLQKDITDTYHVLFASPFERNNAIKQIKQNSAKHPDMYTAIQADPRVTTVPFETVPDCGLQSNLHMQLKYLCLKELQHQVENRTQSWRNS